MLSKIDNLGTLVNDRAVLLKKKPRRLMIQSMKLAMKFIGSLQTRIVFFTWQNGTELYLKGGFMSLPPQLGNLCVT